MKIFKIFLLSLLTIILGVSSAYSIGELNVVLANQNPDPVSPGNFVELNVKVSNSGDTSINDATIRFIENENFKIAQGKQIKKDIGVIPAYSSLTGSNSYVIAKFLIEVAPDTPLGENPVSFEVTTAQGTYNYEFDLSVQDQNPSLEVSNFQIGTVKAGEIGKLTFDITNPNSVTLSNMVVSLGLSDVDDKALSTVSGTNQKVISFLKAGEKKTIEFEIEVSPDADAQPYLLPVEVNYEDSFENSYTTEVLGSVRVYSEPIISLKLDSQEIYTQGNGKITLAIANPGTSSVKGTRIEILPSDEYEIIEGEFQYVGDLNPDDFQTIQANIHISNSDAATLKIKLTYLDSYNQKSEEMIEIPLKIYSQDELVSYGIVAGGGNTSYGSIIFALIMGVIAFFVGRKLGYKKGAKHRK